MKVLIDQPKQWIWNKWLNNNNNNNNNSNKKVVNFIKI